MAEKGRENLRDIHEYLANSTGTATAYKTFFDYAHYTFASH